MLNRPTGTVSRTVVDARPESQSKTSADRQRFIRRAKAQIKEAVKKAITNGDIKSLEKGNVRVPVKDLNEPNFEHDGETGSRDRVYSGNKDWVVGDEIERPPKGGGQGQGQGGSPDGEGKDGFSFILTPDEFYDALFEDMDLPDLIKKSMKQITKTIRRRSGYVVSGNPSQLDIKQTYKFAYARHKALGRPATSEIEELRDQLDNATDLDEDARHRLASLIQNLEQKQSHIPLIDDIDLRYRNYPPRPEPITQAVMICTMDVSGSMDEDRKDLAKRFYLLLYVWLMKQYNQKVDLVFVRHHTEAEEVDEHTFFYDQESGGTKVSPMIDEVAKIIKQRYNPNDWNIYVCHASDGDNWSFDNNDVVSKLKALMPVLQYFAYLQVTDVSEGYSTGDTYPTLWKAYEAVGKSFSNLNMVSASEPDQIWTVFKQLFTKDLQR